MDVAAKVKHLVELMCDIYSIVRATCRTGKILCLSVRAAKNLVESPRRDSRISLIKRNVLRGNIAFASTFHSSAL